jgi:hypothetical protein
MLSMSVRIVRDGQDPLIKPVLDYLARTYRMPAGHIRDLKMDNSTGGPIWLTVTVAVQQEDLPEPAADEVIVSPTPIDHTGYVLGEDHP